MRQGKGIDAFKEECTKCTGSLWRFYHSGEIPVIPDIKCRSPKEGDLLFGRDPVIIAKKLQKAGAPVLSVVTEGEHFGGSLALLSRIAEATGIPILRKDFITTREQLAESRENGASGVLLIASIMEKEQLLELIEASLRLGLEPLVETHNEEEIQTVNQLKPTFLGINNRNILELEMDDGDVNNTVRSAALISSGAFILSESSIASAKEVEQAVAAGVHGVLVGTAILKARDPAAMYYELSIPRG